MNKVYRRTVLTDESGSIIRMVREFPSLDVLFNVPLARLLDDTQIEKNDRPEIFGVTVPMVILRKLLIDGRLGIYTLHPVAVSFSHQSVTRTSSDMIKKYALLTGIRFVNLNDNSELTSLIDRTTNAKASITNNPEAFTGFLAKMALSGSGHTILHEVSINKIIRLDSETGLPEVKRNVFKNSSVDVLVVCNDTGQALLAVEFDGIHHSESAQKKKDDARDELLLDAGIPTIRLSKKNIFNLRDFSRGKGLSPDYIGPKFVMLLLRMLTNEVREQRVLESELLEKLNEAMLSGNIPGNDWLQYTALNIWDLKSGWGSLDEHMNGGVLASYSKLFSDSGVTEPTFTRGYSGDELAVSLKIKERRYSYTVPIKGNFGYLGIWRYLKPHRDLHVDAAVDCLKLILVDNYMMRNEVGYQTFGTNFKSPLQAFLELKDVEMRSRYEEAERAERRKVFREVMELFYPKLKVVE